MAEQKKEVAPVAEQKPRKKEKSITVPVDKNGRHTSKLLSVLKAVVLPILRVLKPFRVYGKKQVSDGACIYVSNHYAMLDIMYPVVTTKEIVHYVAKKEVFEMPVLGWLAKKIRAIGVSRDGSDVRGLLDCFKCLKNGEKICIFPEGTRNKTKEAMLPFKHGAAVMAIKCKAPIIPIVIYKKPKFFRMAHVLIGEPIELTEYYGKKLSDEELSLIDEQLRQRMLDMKQEHAEFLANKKKKA